MYPLVEVLTEEQKLLLSEFYGQPLRKIPINKKERTSIWNSFKEDHSLKLVAEKVRDLPSLVQTLNNSIDSGLNLQSAIISECLFANQLADMFSLQYFAVYSASDEALDTSIKDLLASHKILPRFYYSNESRTKFLFQAGGNAGVDCALVDVIKNKIYAIEFKETLAKTSEPDLPLYGEDGFLVSADWFEEKYPQFKSMIEEQLNAKLNFFNHRGSNINEFSKDSIIEAVTDNYSGSKFADVVVTESSKGFLIMIPANHVSMWATLQGEVRPSGRNYKDAWTPERLQEFIFDLGGTLDQGIVKIPRTNLQNRVGRGSGGKVTGKKIAFLFFVRQAEVTLENEFATFPLNSVQQLKPTITAKMDFKNMKPEVVRDYYLGIINK